MADEKAKLEEIKTLAQNLKSDSSRLHIQYEEIEQMYFMDPDRKNGRVSETNPTGDAEDVKLTISPSVRNAVVGVVRLLTTNEPRFTAKSKKNEAKLVQIGDLCKIMWNESCRAKLADIHTDAARSAALYSDVHLVANNVADLLRSADDDEKVRLTDISTRTPFLFEISQPSEGYPFFGRYGLRGLLREYRTTGEDIKATFGTDNGLDRLGNATNYTLDDWYGMTYRVIWMEGQELINKKHGLPELPIAVQLADGSELWRKEEQRRQPFLYPMWKGGLWRRQNSVLTNIFTAINERGSGILVGFDEEPSDITVGFAGSGVRYIKAPKPRMLSDTAFDPNMIGVIEKILNPLTDSSTIFPQTLGSNEGMGSTPFSSIAMLSTSGQLPTVPIRKAVCGVILRVMLVVLRWIKRDGIDISKIVDMTADDIPDDIDLDVDLDIKLPQDMFKNVQIAETAIDRGIITKAWAQNNLLQISDAKQMRKDIWKEQSGDALYKAMVEKIIQEMSQPTPPPMPTPSPEATPPGADQSGVPPMNPAESVPPAGPVPPPGAESMIAGVQQPGGPQAAGAGGGVIPASVPMGSKMNKGGNGRKAGY